MYGWLELLNALCIILTEIAWRNSFINYFVSLDFLAELAKSPGADTVQYLGSIRSYHYSNDKNLYISQTELSENQ
jgi:hypothetical protein